MTVRILTCSCGGTAEIDTEALAEATGLAVSGPATALCSSGQERLVAFLARAAEAGETPIVACEQEARLFAALAAEAGLPEPSVLDLRDRAAWSNEAREALPKMAALIADATLPAPDEKLMDVRSDGVCVILGRADDVLPLAAELAGRLSVTAILDAPPEDWIPPPTRSFDIAVARLRGARGALGNFALRLDGWRELDPSGRTPAFTSPRDGGEAHCDVILDLRRGEAPLFPAHEKRDGYLRADPGDPAAPWRAALAAAELVGDFERTVHVRLEPELCAHARSGQTGCTRCLDACPTGAITPDGDHVAVDPLVCAGCGACSALCPSGAIALDAPPVGHLFRRIEAMARAYRQAGGKAPRLLVHDADESREAIALLARYGAGLPADLVPMSVSSVAGFGHAEMLGALGAGFAEVVLLPGPRADQETITHELALARAILSGIGVGSERVRAVPPAEPERLAEDLRPAAPPPPERAPILPVGSRRDITREAALRLADTPPEAPVPLPAAAPYGSVVLDVEACTLCLSCVGHCPAGALGDNPDRPELTFTETACLQCGLCVSVCPENAIAITPRLDLSEGARRPRSLKREEPFNCISCGKPFGTRATIERIMARLVGAHPMFADSERARLIQMCDDCRVQAQFHAEGAPLGFGAPRRPRTTDDYAPGNTGRGGGEGEDEGSGTLH